MQVLKRNAGFSMVELLVVVAIIAILSFIALPRYKSYQARARRAEGMNMLSAYYTASHNARAEYGVFPGNLVDTGYAPQGLINYRFRTNDNPGFQARTRTFDNGCIATWSTCNCSGGGSAPCPSFKTWTEKPMGTPGVRLGPTTVAVNCGSLAPLGPTTDNAFSARVGGVINLYSSRTDRIGMDHMKNIQVCQDGVR